METKHSDLIYDVGMHKGEDTEYYLKKGFNVIAFEANPDLVNYCKKKFNKELETGRLIIVEGAITDLSLDKNNLQTLKFYKNNQLSEWGTIDTNWADRNKHLGTSFEIIEVPAVNFESCLLKYGIPYYMKIDIEGMDKVCLNALLPFNQKPDYVSIESEKISFKKLKEELNLLQKLGFTKFKAINQADITLQVEPQNSGERHYVGHTFIIDTSGLFGKDLQNNWKNYYQILIKYRLIFWGYKLFGDFGILKNTNASRIFKKVFKRLFGTTIPGWYDTHAKHSSIIND